MFQAYVSPAGTLKTKEFLNKPLIKGKKNKNRGLSICRLLWILHETNLKPGQNVIAGLHERMFAKTQVERSTLDEKEATIAFLHT